MGKVLSRPETANRTPVKALRTSKTPYQRALDSARALPFEELIELIDTLRDETREKRNARYMADVDKSIAEIERGEYFEGTLDEVLKALNE